MTIRCPLSHKIYWNRVIFEDQKPYFTALVEKWIENASYWSEVLYTASYGIQVMAVSNFPLRIVSAALRSTNLETVGKMA